MLVMRYICVCQLTLICVLNFLFMNKKYCINAIAWILFKVGIVIKFGIS
jgi:hypothetical protein